MRINLVRVAEVVLAVCTPAADREGYLGDVAELHADRRRTRSDFRASAFLLREVGAASARFLSRRSGSALRCAPHGLPRAIGGFGLAAALFAVINHPPVVAVLRNLDFPGTWVAKIAINAIVLAVAAGTATIGQSKGRFGGWLAFVVLILSYPVLASLAEDGPMAAFGVMQTWRPPGWWMVLVASCAAAGTFVAAELPRRGHRRSGVGSMVWIVLPLLAGAGQVSGQRPDAAIGTEEVTIESDGWQLRGELYLPMDVWEPWPLTVLLHEAAGDRSEFRSLAEQLAEWALRRWRSIFVVMARVRTGATSCRVLGVVTR